ncbi:integrase, catalytic region, zinc finger, CCHC-type containing protein [Tanacetum coccineum]
MSEQIINHVNNWEKANKEQNNESVTAKLERYKKQVKTFEQRLNIDLSKREKMIDSQMDDMIREKLALKEQVDSLEQNLSKQIKEKECLLQTFTVFKSKSKEKEDKYMENEIDLEKKIKELNSIFFKVGQSAQTVHMLTKPQAFYDNIHKQALGYQNPFHLKKAQRIKPTLYDGIVVFDKHVAMPVIDDEETLILEEESRSKMSEKQRIQRLLNISHKPIDYKKLNRLTEDFRKRFTPQQELSGEQAFWLYMSDPTSKPSDVLPIKIEVPNELPKISLVNESLKKLKFHLAKFDNVVKIRTTPNARTECEWGFEHTKVVFNNEIIPFLKSLKDIFNVFDRDLLNEIMEVKTIFDQMDATVQQSLVHKQCLKIAKKELLLENDQLLQQIMSQEVLLTVINSMLLIGETVNVDGNRKESCNLEAELLKSQNAFNDLLKRHSQLEKHCISLECSIQLNQEIFQKRESCDNQNALEILEFFEKNDLKAQLQDKDSTNCKLKDLIKSMREKSKDENVKYDYCEKETKNVKLENKNEDLKAQIQDKVFVITSLKNDLQKIKGNKIVDIAAQIPSANTIVPGMFKLDLETLAPRLLQNREAHIDYLKYTQEQADILWGMVKQAKVAQPLDKELDFACKHAQRIQELHVYIKDTCPNSIKLNEKKVVVTPKNKVKKVRFAEPLTSSSNVKQVQVKKTKIVESNNANHSKLNRTWESNATDIPSSSSLVMTASKTKSWLWHRPLSHLNFGTINKLDKHSLARGNPRLKFQKDHLCSACALGKSKKSSHQPKAEDTNQEKLYLLHMDLCGPICVASINGKMYILDKKPDLSFFHVFGALCYPTNDNNDLEKLDAKANIGNFIGYVPAKKAFRIYNKRTQKIIETIHVIFNELAAMASEQFSSGPELDSCNIQFKTRSKPCFSTTLYSTK